MQILVSKSTSGYMKLKKKTSYKATEFYFKITYLQKRLVRQYDKMIVICLWGSEIFIFILYFLTCVNI